jgi:predicted DNA-binding transcriptional regulator YafY
VIVPSTARIPTGGSAAGEERGSLGRTMGRQSGVATAAAILKAFEGGRRWRQADLARHVGVRVPALRRHLSELVELLPVVDERDGSDVYWSLPNGWTSQGARVPMDTLAQLVQLLARSPTSKLRDEVLALLLKKNPRQPAPDRVSAPALSADEDRVLPMLEAALKERGVLGMHYFSASSGRLRRRDVTVQRVLTGPPVRFVAYCHVERELRWFRADNVQSMWSAPSEAPAVVDPAEVEAFVERGVDGFAARGVSDEPHKLFVRDPDAAWVKRNLRVGMRAHDAPGGVRIVARPEGLLPFARFAVGLGDAATPETPALTAAVRALAEGALREVDPHRGKRGGAPRGSRPRRE